MLGFMVKVILVYHRPWWRELNLSGTFQSMRGPVSFTRDTCVEEDNQYSITCFMAGDSGRLWAKLPQATRRKRVVDQVHRLAVAAGTVATAIPDPINIIEQDWSKEPWIRGVPSPVMPPGLMTSEAGQSIRAPVGNVHFVGTETAVVWKGYMEGAVRSGIRGAAEVVDLLVPSRPVISLSQLRL